MSNSQHIHHDHHHHDINFKELFTVTKEPGSQVKIVGEIPAQELEQERGAAIKALGASVELAGFRKGHIPESILVKHLGEMNILTEMAERVIAHMYPHIIEAHALDPIGHPKIEITKIAPGNPLGLSMTVAVMPPVVLGDYKKIAAAINKSRESDAVTEEDVTNQITAIQRQKQAYDRIQQKAKAKEAAAAGDLPTPETVDRGENLADLPLPPLTDDYVQSLGQPGQFPDVATFKKNVAEHLSLEKKQSVRNAHRVKLTDAIVADCSLELPQILIDSEIRQMFAQMNEDLTRANLKLEDYLNHIKKTEAELTKDWEPAATKRAKLQLVLNEIAKTENITPDTTELTKQVKAIMDTYKEADPMRVYTYVASILTNDAVLQKLETL